MMNNDPLIADFTIKLQRIHVLSDILISLLVDNQQALILTEIIMDTSLLPEV